MFKNEYQGGPFVEIFSAHGKDSFAKWKVVGGASAVRKVYEKDVKGYIYSLEGGTSTTKVQLPKDEKQSLSLIQRYVVIQLCVPLGQSFAFEVTVSDLANSKRRIFFSSSNREISVTPLHARFPLSVMRLGVWLNLCVDLLSFVGETFKGQTFRAIESITISANCRLRKIFTMKTQPPDTTDDDEIYGLENTNQGELEPIPRACALSTAPGVSHYTQVLTMAKLRQVEAKFGRLTLSSADTDLQSRQDNEEPTHIAFGSKVKIPAHARKTSSRDSTRDGSGSRTSRSSHSRTQVDPSSSQQAELESSWNNVHARSRLNSEGEPETPRPQLEVEAAAQCLQPRPPKTGSAGQTRRRPVRVRSAGKTRTQDNKGVSNVVSTTGYERNDLNESTDKNNKDQNNNVEKEDFQQNVEDDKNDSECLKIENIPSGKQDLLSSDELSRYIQNIDIARKTDFNSSLDEEVENATNKNYVAGSMNDDTNTIDPVFTFSSRPRSAPRSPKPRQNGDVEQNVSKETGSELNESDGLQSRGAKYEDDFFKHSSDSSSEDDEVLQRLLKSSLTQREGSQSSNHSSPLQNGKRKVRRKKKKRQDQLLNSSVTSVSIKSSLLKEIPSPRKKEEETYNAKNYQSETNPWNTFASNASSWMFDMSTANQSFPEGSSLADKLERERNSTNGHIVNNRSSLESKEDSDSEIEDRDDGDNTLSLSSSDETTLSSWRPPPIHIRGHRYQDEMKPPGPLPDLTATLPLDARVYAGAFSPPINTGLSSDLRNGLSIVLSPPTNGLTSKSQRLSNGDSDMSASQADQEEEELDLLYDPCLNCYFDPKTCKYYELS